MTHLKLKNQKVLGKTVLNSPLRNFVHSGHFNYSWFLRSITTMFFLLCSPCWADESALGTGSTFSELQARGKQFRAEVESTFLKMSRADARRSYDLIDVCKKNFPIGTSFTDVKVILVAAGADAAEPLWPIYNRASPVEGSPDRNDISSGFLLDKSRVSHTIFEIFFRPNILDESHREIAKVMSCGALTTNL